MQLDSDQPPRRPADRRRGPRPPRLHRRQPPGYADGMDRPDPGPLGRTGLARHAQRPDRRPRPTPSNASIQVFKALGGGWDPMTDATGARPRAAISAKKTKLHDPPLDRCRPRPVLLATTGLGRLRQEGRRRTANAAGRRPAPSRVGHPAAPRRSAAGSAPRACWSRARRPPSARSFPATASPPSAPTRATRSAPASPWRSWTTPCCAPRSTSRRPRPPRPRPRPSASPASTARASCPRSRSRPAASRPRPQKAALTEMKHPRQSRMTIVAPGQRPWSWSATVRPGDDRRRRTTPWFTHRPRRAWSSWTPQVNETDVAKIRAGQPVQVTLPSGAVGVDGQVRLVSPRIDQHQAGLGKVRVRLPVRPDLRPGGFGRATFNPVGRRPVTAVPESAIRYDADGAVGDHRRRQQPRPPGAGEDRRRRAAAGSSSWSRARRREPASCWAARRSSLDGDTGASRGRHASRRPADGCEHELKTGELKISAWAIKNPIPVAVLFIALIIAGRRLLPGPADQAVPQRLIPRRDRHGHPEQRRARRDGDPDHPSHRGRDGQHLQRQDHPLVGGPGRLDHHDRVRARRGPAEGHRRGALQGRPDPLPAAARDRRADRPAAGDHSAPRSSPTPSRPRT